MELRIEIAPGEVIEIPHRLRQSVQSAEGLEASKLDDQHPDNLLQLAQQQSDPGSAALTALKAGMIFAQQHNPEQAVLCLGTYASRKASSLASSGKPREGLAILVDFMDLANRALAWYRPSAIRQLAQLLASTIEQAISLYSWLQPAYILASTDDISSVLDIALTLWGPDLEAEIRELQGILLSVSGIVKGNTGQDHQQEATPEEIVQGLSAIQGRSSTTRARRSRSRKSLQLLEQLTSALMTAVQQEVLLASRIQSGHRARSDAESAARQAQELIAQVEKQLRALIAEEYSKRFGATWVQHVESKHKEMYANWMRTMQRDQTTFRSYGNHSPAILEYTTLHDLIKLIASEWEMFLTILDLGYGNRNKTIFCDKMERIAKVRNPLAHHRSIPENEILRAKVLCTDILLALKCRDEQLEQ